MSYLPKRESSAGVVLTVLLFLVAAVCFVSSSFLPYRTVWQCVSVAALVIGIDITQKFWLCSYEYIINPFEEIYKENLITVLKKQGRSTKKVCNLTLDLAKGIVPKKQVKELCEKFGKPHYKFNFCADLFPKSAYCLMLEFNGKYAVITLQCDEKFAKEIELRIPAEE